MNKSIIPFHELKNLEVLYDEIAAITSLLEVNNDITIYDINMITFDKDFKPLKSQIVYFDKITYNLNKSLNVKVNDVYDYMNLSENEQIEYIKTYKNILRKYVNENLTDYKNLKTYISDRLNEIVGVKSQ